MDFVSFYNFSQFYFLCQIHEYPCHPAMCMRQNTLQVVCMHGPTTACVKSTNIPAILLCACIKTLKYSLHAFAYCLLCQIHEYLSHPAACMHLHGPHFILENLVTFDTLPFCILSKLTLIEIVFLGPFLPP